MEIIFILTSIIALIVLVVYLLFFPFPGMQARTALSDRLATIRDGRELI